MTREDSSRSLVRVAAMLVAAAAVACLGCGGGGGGGGSPTNPPAPTMDAASASFRLVGGGEDGAVSYTNGPNLVFCRSAAGFADLFIRFAQQPAADGENGPHLDIDVCNLGNGGAFAPKDPQVPSCAGGQQTFDVFWHGAGGIFLNVANAPMCTLNVTRDGTMLSGSFQCRGMVELGGNRQLDLLDGSFECVEG